MTFEAVCDRVIVCPIEAEKTSRGGIIMPKEDDSVARLAEVVAVGPGLYSHRAGAFMPMHVKVGDRVMIQAAKYSIDTIHNPDDGKKYYSLRQEDIFAIVRG